MSGAEIDVPPPMGLAAPGVGRLDTEPADAHAAGTDPGAEVPPIPADRDARLTLHDDLERELAGLQSALEQLGVPDRLAGPVLQHLLDEVRQLADPARHGPHRGREA